MGGFVILGMLAAFGLVCALWVLVGLLLPCRSGTLIFLGDDALTAAQRHLWLREMGLTRDRMVVLDQENLDREWLNTRGIEIWSREELIQRLKIGERQIDAGA